MGKNTRFTSFDLATRTHVGSLDGASRFNKRSELVNVDLKRHSKSILYSLYFEALQNYGNSGNEGIMIRLLKRLQGDGITSIMYHSQMINKI